MVTLDASSSPSPPPSSCDGMQIIMIKSILVRMVKLNGTMNYDLLLHNSDVLYHVFSSSRLLNECGSLKSSNYFYILLRIFPLDISLLQFVYGYLWTDMYVVLGMLMIRIFLVRNTCTNRWYTTPCSFIICLYICYGV